jgi:hypothetical protein
MRVGQGDRIIVPTYGTVAPGATFLIAVRPERVRLDPKPLDAWDGSRVSGTIAQVVYLGTLTQFHVETPLGKRLIAHGLSDERTASVSAGDQVTLTWRVEDASILRG